jgi:hypothetical protein
VASVQLQGLRDPDTYQTASGQSLLDSALDQLIAGEVFDAELEQQLIQRQWQINP